MLLKIKTTQREGCLVAVLLSVDSVLDLFHLILVLEIIFYQHR